jgi:hypothetical protein
MRPVCNSVVRRMPPAGRAARRFVALGLISLAAASAAACSASPPPSMSSSDATNGFTTPDTSSAGSTATPDTADGHGLPVQKYLITDSEAVKFQDAQDVLITQCMKGFGFTFIPQRPAPSTGVDSDAANMSRRYGVSNLATIDAYGYHARAAPAPPPPIDELTSLSVAEYEVLWGHSEKSDSDTVTRTPSGVPIPSGGCMVESAQTFDRLAPTPKQARLPGQINSDSFTRSQSDPRVVTVIAAWSKCMAGSGYAVTSPLAVMAPFTGPLPASAAEIAEAKADLACKDRTRLIETWDTVETQLENQMIAQNKQSLTTVAQDLQAGLKVAAQVLARQSP